MKTGIISAILIISAIFLNINDTIGKDTNSEPLMAYRKDSLWYFVDHDAKLMFPSKKIKKIAGYREGFFVIVYEANKRENWAFMDLKGEVFQPVGADEVRQFRNGMAMTIKHIDTATGESNYGYINNQGLQVVPNKYLDATDFSEGLGWVMNRKERGYVNTNGEFVSLFESGIFGNPFFEGMASYHDESGLFGFIDTSFKPIIPAKFDEVANFSDGLAAFSENAKFGFLDKKGNVVVRPNYDAVTDFKEGIAFVGQADTNQLYLWGIINKSGRMLVDLQYDQVREFSEGLIAVRKKDKWFFIDQFGNKVIKNDFDFAESFKNGIAFVSDKKEKKKGFINPLGEWVFFVDETELMVDLRWNRIVK